MLSLQQLEIMPRLVKCKSRSRIRMSQTRSCICRSHVRAIASCVSCISPWIGRRTSQTSFDVQFDGWSIFTKSQSKIATSVQPIEDWCPSCQRRRVFVPQTAPRFILHRAPQNVCDCILMHPMTRPFLHLYICVLCLSGPINAIGKKIRTPTSQGWSASATQLFFNLYPAVE